MMKPYIVRAVPQPNGTYRAVVNPANPAVQPDAVYSREEIEAIAQSLPAELRWIEAPGGSRRSHMPASPGEGAEANTDPWGGELPPIDEI